jgi:hypothetical protein
VATSQLTGATDCNGIGSASVTCGGCQADGSLKGADAEKEKASCNSDCFVVNNQICFAAKKSAQGNGRSYTVVISVSDTCGNQASLSKVISVPKSAAGIDIKTCAPGNSRTRPVASADGAVDTSSAAGSGAAASAVVAIVVVAIIVLVVAGVVIYKSLQKNMRVVSTMRSEKFETTTSPLGDREIFINPVYGEQVDFEEETFQEVSFLTSEHANTV